MQYGCIAEHLKHSFSPEIHAQLANYRYELRELAPADVPAFLREKDFLGINVTIPYKETVIPYLYEIDEAAKAIGAVNTIVNRDGKLYGYNTDFYGMKTMIEHLGISPRGKKIAVLGTGGTSRTARAVATAMGAEVVLSVGRSQKDGVISYETLIREHSDTQILINTTPCGMYPNADGNERIAACAVDISNFPQLEGVVDAVYNPLRPQLVMDARTRGIPSEGGLYMLVAQAVRASEIFLGTTYPPDTVERVYRTVFAAKENIVLIGMPGSGKSTVGHILADLLGRHFCDLDDAIVQKAGMAIPEIFAQNGEVGFRDLETQVVKERAQIGCTVIATGGGAILRDENVNALRRNGKLVFLDRPLQDLLPTEDRPLASSADAIRKRYEERYDRYCTVADLRVPIDADAETVARRIQKELMLV